MISYSPLVTKFLIINLLVYLIQALGRFPLPDILGIHYLRSDAFEPFQFFTYMFVHGDFFHLFHNMFAVFMFAPAVEYVIGSQRFIVFYLVCGIGAGILYSIIQYFEVRELEIARDLFLSSPTLENFEHFIMIYSKDFSLLNEHQYHFVNKIIPKIISTPEGVQQAKTFVANIFEMRSNVPMVGASGAVFGILTAFGIIYPNLELLLFPIPIPIKAKYVVGAYVLWEIYATINQNPYDNVAHIAHVAGAFLGFLMIYFWYFRRRRY
ncbi:MAG: rhomboid family intramembrane serine protease [Cytophagales bacterium]|nr:rhomboid family intramembrane serine protease [Cytophagales bacterium]MDW8383913.1 rhomboid family intramembrane serine protease [Flammeovirgaceae bacterium]